MTLQTAARPPRPAAPDPLAGFLSELDRFMVDHVDPLRIDRDHHLPRHLLTELAGLGVFGVTIPEEHGGSELGLAGACAVVDALARRDRAVATTVGLHLGLGTRGLVAFGSPEQRRRWLPSLAAGEKIAAFATTEPGSGSDLTRLSTKARVDGDHVSVSGEKIYVTNGGLAEVFTITAATEGFGDQLAGRALVVLERRDKGLEVGPEEHKLGLRGSSTTSLRLDELDLSTDRLIGPPGAGPDQLAHVLAWGRTAMAAGCCGTAHAALDKAKDHVQLRQQFGRPLSTQPIIRAQLADMAATLSAMRALVRATAEASTLIPLGEVKGPAVIELERLSLAAKVFASEGDWFICDLALQLHGGSGYIEETGASLLLRDARITRIFEGANDVLLTRLGQLELTQPLPPSEHDPLAHHVSKLIEHARKLGLAALRDHRLLHRLGRLVTLRLAAKALGPTTGALAEHARHRLAEQAAAAAMTSDPGTADLVCEALLDPHQRELLR